MLERMKGTIRVKIIKVKRANGTFKLKYCYPHCDFAEQREMTVLGRDAQDELGAAKYALEMIARVNECEAVLVGDEK